MTNKIKKVVSSDNNKLYHKVERSLRRKRLALTVNNDGLVIVKASMTEKLAVIERFVRDNESWITAKKKQIQKVYQTQKKYVDGELFYILGKPFQLQINEQQLAKLIVDDEENFISLASRYQNNAAELIEKWYRFNAEKYLIERAKFFLKKYLFRYQNIRIKSTKSQWGSCSIDGNLSFTWHLYMLPVEVIDYVIIHELAHLNEMNHSALFWQEVENMMPNYYENRSFLKQYGNRIITSLTKNLKPFNYNNIE